MHAHQKTSPSLYELLEALPEGLTGEILNGQLYTQPRPSGPHVFAASELGYELLGPFERGRGGPGGWWIVQEPALEGDAWREIGRFAGAAPVSAAPFEAVTIRLDDLWAPTE
ncbi:hypothetical protein [uncultured Thiodictyon sp.]|uniref:hypothetical protein n=1 Tax=uncultured Thiodictyon sp. TaxID=1846217 RepID=UPI0025D2BE8E|nr:hypothetical protein [uncultured Thiodictyon sp.]